MNAGPLVRLRAAGIAEGFTLVTLVLVAVPLKYVAGWPVGVAVMGPIHGVAFIFYVVTLIECAAAGLVRGGLLLRTALACLIHFGTFLNEGALRRRGQELQAMQ